MGQGLIGPRVGPALYELSHDFKTLLPKILRNTINYHEQSLFTIGFVKESRDIMKSIEFLDILDSFLRSSRYMLVF